MAEQNEARVLRMVVIYLRFQADMSQAEFGRASRVDQSDISKYERGDQDAHRGVAAPDGQGRERGLARGRPPSPRLRRGALLAGLPKRDFGAAVPS